MADPKSPDGHCWDAYKGCKAFSEACACKCAACIVALGGTDQPPRKKSSRGMAEDAIRASKERRPWPTS